MSLKQEERDIMVARIEPTRSLIEKIKKYIAEKQAQ